MNADSARALLLAVTRRRVAGIGPSALLERYERDRFVRPSALAPRAPTETIRRAHAVHPIAALQNGGVPFDP